MRRYTNQNLTAAQVIAELVALAKEVSADANRGATFAPPLNTDDKIRSTIKRLLAKYGYPPDAEADAIKRVLDQMETFADDWSPEA